MLPEAVLCQREHVTRNRAQFVPTGSPHNLTQAHAIETSAQGVRPSLATNSAPDQGVGRRAEASRPESVFFSEED